MTAPHVPPAVILAAAAAVQRALSRPRRAPSTGSIASAAALATASVAFLASSAREFWRARTTVNPVSPQTATSLVTSGPHQLSRNPMYVGMAGMLVAHAVARRSWPAALPVAGFVAVMSRTQIAAEEEALAEVFGQEYRDYCARVPRWLWPPAGAWRRREIAHRPAHRWQGRGVKSAVCESP